MGARRRGSEICTYTSDSATPVTGELAVTCFSTRAGEAVTVSAYALGTSANPVVSRLTTRRAWPVERRRLCRCMGFLRNLTECRTSPRFGRGEELGDSAVPPRPGAAWDLNSSTALPSWTTG